MFADLIAVEAMLLQPFQQSVLEQGEISLMVMDGRVSHAIRKTPKANDFRVQDDHGGTVTHARPVPKKSPLPRRRWPPRRLT